MIGAFSGNLTFQPTSEFVCCSFVFHPAGCMFLCYSNILDTIYIVCVCLSMYEGMHTLIYILIPICMCWPSLSWWNMKCKNIVRSFNGTNSVQMIWVLYSLPPCVDVFILCNSPDWTFVCSSSHFWLPRLATKSMWIATTYIKLPIFGSSSKILCVNKHFEKYKIEKKKFLDKILFSMSTCWLVFCNEWSIKLQVSICIKEDNIAKASLHIRMFSLRM